MGRVGLHGRSPERADQPLGGFLRFVSFPASGKSKQPGVFWG